MTPSTVAGVLMAIGTAVVVAGLHRQAAGLRLPVTDPGLALAMLRALRTTILGLAIVGAAAGWLWHVRPLLLVSLVIAGEEMLEISVVVAAVNGYVTAGGATPRGRRSAPARPPSARRR